LHKLQVAWRFLILSLLFVVNVQADSPYPDRLSYIDSVGQLIFSNANLARKKLDSLRDQVKLSKDEFLAMQNKYGIYFGVRGEVDSAFYYFNYILDQTDKRHRRHLSALHNISLLYKNSGQYDKALEVLNSLLVETQQQVIKDQEALVLGEIASVYNQLELYDLAISYLERSIRIYETLPSPLFERRNVELQKLANTYLTNGDYSFAIKIYEEVLPKFKEKADIYNYHITLINYALALRDARRYEKALSVAEEAVRYLLDIGNRDLLSVAYLAIAEIRKDMAKPHESIVQFYERSLTESRTGNNKYTQKIYLSYIRYLRDAAYLNEAYNTLRRAEEEQALTPCRLHSCREYYVLRASMLAARGNLRESNEAWAAAIRYSDSITNDIRLKVTREKQEKYKNEVLESEIEMSRLREQDLEKKVRIRGLYFIIVLLFSAVVAAIAYQYHLKNNFKRLQISQLKKEQELAHREKEIADEHVRLQQEIIDQQQMQLVAYALDVARHNEQVETMLEELKTTNTPDIVHSLNALKSTDSHWEALMNRFSNLHPHFIDKMKSRYPELTQSELEFCALVKLNLSYKDIAGIMNISHQSVFKKKYRVSQKIKVTEEEDFFSVINSIA
jgi:tetratricopeptide (TPR) repeat protein/DNA-binding CsgD family transcriptional regulator